MPMIKIQNIFVVLTYMNSADLEDFLKSLSKVASDYKVIVVNSFYNRKTKMKIEAIANQYNCDFLNVENKGYSYGNNRGIEYALEHYDFCYLTVSNADIIVKKYKTDNLPSEGIFAGVIIARDGRAQNPMVVHECRLREKLGYEAFKQNKKWMMICSIGINKIDRECFLLLHRDIRKDRTDSLKLVKVSQAHGSFIVFARLSLAKLWNGTDVNYKGVFDENMFLFAEESVLAKRARRLGIPIYYGNFAICNHKEDGSMKLSMIDTSGELAKSNVYYYEKYCKK